MNFIALNFHLETLQFDFSDLGISSKLQISYYVVYWMVFQIIILQKSWYEFISTFI